MLGKIRIRELRVTEVTESDRWSGKAAPRWHLSRSLKDGKGMNHRKMLKNSKWKDPEVRMDLGVQGLSRWPEWPEQSGKGVELFRDIAVERSRLHGVSWAMVRAFEFTYKCNRKPLEGREQGQACCEVCFIKISLVLFSKSSNSGSLWGWRL